jgi:DNA-3-methyladenine glycosylase
VRFDRSVHDVARDLVGMTLRHGETAGRIVEVESYHQEEPACHAFIGPRPRTEVLFGPAGHAYVYRSYGIHALVNVVAEREGVGAAVLIRALEPLDGVELMRERRGVARDLELTNGPGKLTEALGIGLAMNGLRLGVGSEGAAVPDAAAPIRIEPRPADAREPEVVLGPRIGITKAVELQWRFCDGTSEYVSRPWPPAMRRAPHRVGA